MGSQLYNRRKEDLFPTKKTHVIVYTSEGSKLEEEIWYAVFADDAVQAYSMLWDYLVAEDPEWSYIEQGVKAFTDDHECMFVIDGPMSASCPGMKIQEVPEKVKA